MNYFLVKNCLIKSFSNKISLNYSYIVWIATNSWKVKRITKWINVIFSLLILLFLQKMSEKHDRVFFRCTRCQNTYYATQCGMNESRMCLTCLQRNTPTRIVRWLFLPNRSSIGWKSPIFVNLMELIFVFCFQTNKAGDGQRKPSPKRDSRGKRTWSTSMAFVRKHNTSFWTMRKQLDYSCLRLNMIRVQSPSIFPKSF